MTALATPPKLQFLDSNGAPLVGGKLYTYAAGTTTPQVTYTDYVGGTPNANPVILDSRGEASVWLSTSLYKMALYSATDVLIWTVDNIGGFATLAQLAASGGSNLIGFLQAGTGAVPTTVQTKLRESVSVFDFMTAAQIADVQANTAAIDVTAAIQAAIDSLPLNTASPGIMSPEGFANGGEIFIPRGRYKVTATLNLRRGINLQGESREASQLVSFFAGSVLQYLDAGRAYPDEIVISSLSIWQDSSVVATSGAGIDVIDGPATVQAVFLRVDDVLIKGTYHGIRMSAAIGCGVRDSMISNTISHGVTVPTGVGFTQSTSIVFENVYSQQSQTGSGFFLQSTAYTNFISCAADVNARYGYELSSTTAVSIFSGAEANLLGGVSLLQARGTQCFVNIVDNATANANAITLNQSSATVIGGVLSSTAGASGYAIYSIASGTAATFSAGLIRTGGWDNIAQRSNASHLLELNQLNGFTGGVTRQFAFGIAQALPTRQLHNSGLADSTVTDGFITDVALSQTGTISSALIARAQTQNVVVTWPVLNGAYVQAPIKGAASTVTRYNGVLVDESTIGVNANTNLAIGTSAPAVGTWNIYSISTRDNVWFGKQRYLSSTGPTQSFGAGSPEGVLAAPVGSQYGRTDGGAGTSFYVKESGTGNTGWVGK